MGLLRLRCNSIKFHYTVLISEMLLVLTVLTFKPVPVGAKMNGNMLV